eukprot:gene31002-37469_t
MKNKADTQDNTSSTAVTGEDGKTEIGADAKSATVPIDVSSIITQVDRDAPPATIVSHAESRLLHRSTTRPASAPPLTLVCAADPQNYKAKKPPAPPSSPGAPQRRSFFSRLLCCAPKPASAQPGGQISLVAPSNPSGGAHGKDKKSTKSTRLEALEHSQHTARSKHAGGARAKKCLALDLDETLVHSSFQPVDNASFTIKVVIDSVTHNIYVMKRPGVDQFISRLAEHYELVIYTASLSKYADPLLDLLDPKRLISRRLFRENCVFYDGHYVKDLSLLGRDISQTIIVDNAPTSYIFHPENAIDCTSFFDDPADVELWQIADFLESIRQCEDVRAHCRSWKEWCRRNPSSAPLRPSVP